MQVVGPLEYTARDPADLSITPLSSPAPVKVSQVKIPDIKFIAYFAISCQKKCNAFLPTKNQYFVIFEDKNPCVVNFHRARISSVGIPIEKDSGDVSVYVYLLWSVQGSMEHWREAPELTHRIWKACGRAGRHTRQRGNVAHMISRLHS